MPKIVWGININSENLSLLPQMPLNCHRLDRHWTRTLIHIFLSASLGPPEPKIYFMFINFFFSFFCLVNEATSRWWMCLLILRSLRPVLCFALKIDIFSSLIVIVGAFGNCVMVFLIHFFSSWGKHSWVDWVWSWSFSGLSDIKADESIQSRLKFLSWSFAIPNDNKSSGELLSK